MTLTERPDSGFLYINLHLDYDLEKTDGWQRSGETALGVNELGNLYDDILEGTEYAFSHTVGGTLGGEDFIFNDNIFKNIRGVGGIITDQNENPLEGETVLFYDSSGALRTTAVTDEDGWYFGDFKATGKQAEYTVIWDSDASGGLTAGDQQQVVLLGGPIKYQNADFSGVDVNP